MRLGECAHRGSSWVMRLKLCLRRRWWRGRFHLSWLICLVRGFGVAEGVEDHLLVCGDGRGEGLGGAVDRDGGRAQWA